ncbi:MAG: hypothetical protein ACRDCE_21370 [Cetobacterium sp.]|uniref:hypothetical protein n=1 Tax=Cetobacterium sp. TaxID=2071632 RepID=UPI003EE74220
MALPPMHRMAYPIKTPEAYAFWASHHKCNRIKAIIAFSTSVDDAMHNMRRFGIQSHLRLRALKAFSGFVASPDMDNIPFSEMETPWWECIPHEPVPPVKGHWAVWDDDTSWDDDTDWTEWIEDNTRRAENAPDFFEGV